MTLFLALFSIIVAWADPVFCRQDQGAPGRVGALIRAEAAADEQAEDNYEQVLRELESVETQAAELGARVRAARKKRRSLDAHLAMLALKKAQTQRIVRQLEQQASRRLAVYYKLVQTGLAPLLFSAGNFSEMGIRRRAFSRILEADENRWRNLAIQRDNLAALTVELQESRREAKALESALEQSLARLWRRRRQKDKLLAAIRRDKALAGAALKGIEKAGRRLSRTVTALEGVEKPRPGKVVQGFEALKGRLPWPVAGSVDLAFGARDKLVPGVAAPSRGIQIQCPAGTPIRAVADGVVAYAGWFPGYGKLIIIGHGRGYYSVCAHAEDLFKKKGDKVEQGEVVATVGDTWSMRGPGLYFELRHHAKPVDPEPWFAAR